MPDDEERVQHCSLVTTVDLRETLDAAAIEYLDVDESRTIVIYRNAILMVTATEGRSAAAQAFDVSLWEPPADDRDRDLSEFLQAFVDELLTATDESRQ